VIAYAEFPFIVRRRRGDDPAAERARISADMSEVQGRMRHHAGVLRIEAPRVANCYTQLVAAARRVAGAAIHDAWDTAPIAVDGQMHVTDIDLGAIASYEQRYVTTAKDQLSMGPWWVYSLARWMAGVPRRLWRWSRHHRDTLPELAGDVST